MDPMRIAVRVAFGYLFALVMIRASGKRTIAQGDTHSLVLAIIIGDLFDDLFWAEVAAAEFVAALSTLVTLHVLAGAGLHASGRRTWRRASARSGA